MKSVSVSVPGKVMLAGEYSVLRGGRSLSFTVDKRLKAFATKCSDKFLIASNLWQDPIDLNQQRVGEPNPLLNTMEWAQQNWSANHAEIRITSQIEISDGLGSSSAVRLASLMALGELLDHSSSGWEIPRLLWSLQKKEQGFASGYDFVTQKTGGLVEFTPDYSQWPGDVTQRKWNKLEDHIHIFRGGAGAPTTTVAFSTSQWLRENGLESELDQKSENLIDQFLYFNRTGFDLAELVGAVRDHRKIFEKTPKFPSHLLRALSELKGFDKEWTFKTTGAGGEDSILLIGSKQAIQEAKSCLSVFQWQELGSPFCREGIITEVEEN